jgi:hypothetical protein
MLHLKDFAVMKWPVVFLLHGSIENGKFFIRATEKGSRLFLQKMP